MIKRFLPLLILLCIAPFSMTGNAGTLVAWTIMNANFADGSLTGSFTLDYESPTLPLVTAVNISSTGTTLGSYFYSTNAYSFNSSDYYALVPLAHNVDCSGALPSEACPYVQLYGANVNSLQTGTLTATILNLVFPTNLPMTGGIVPLLMSHDNPIAGGVPPASSCVASIQCTSEQAFVGQAETIPPTGTPSEYRGLLDPIEGPYLVGTVESVPLPASWMLFTSSSIFTLLAQRRRSRQSS